MKPIEYHRDITIRKSRITGHWVVQWGPGPFNRQGWRRWSEALAQAEELAAGRCETERRLVAAMDAHARTVIA